MAILSLSEMPQLQKITLNYGYKIHVHDACGGQSFTLEQISETPSKEIFNSIEEFFIKRKLKIEYFGRDNLNFIVH